MSYVLRKPDLRQLLRSRASACVPHLLPKALYVLWLYARQVARHRSREPGCRLGDEDSLIDPGKVK